MCLLQKTVPSEVKQLAGAVRVSYFLLEIDRYLSIFTIIGYRFCKKNKTFFLLFVTYTIIQSITSSEMCSLYFTHTWSSGHCSLRRSSSTTTACNFIQDSLVWNTLNYINIYYRTIISPINISINTSLSKCIINYLRKRSQFEYSSV